MAWVRVDDQFSENPKHAAVGPVGWGVWLAGLAYCNRNLTDGFIPRSVAHTFADFKMVDAEGWIWTIARTSGSGGADLDGEWIAGRLVEAGIWHESDGGYMVHDYLEFQPSREAVTAKRAKTAERVGRYRGRRNAVTNAPVTPPVTINSAPKDGAPAGNAAKSDRSTGVDVTLAPNPNPNKGKEPLRGSKRTQRRVKRLTPKQRAKLVTDFTPVFGSASNVEDRIESALDHKASTNYTDMNRYVRGWLRRDAERVPGGMSQRAEIERYPEPLWEDFERIIQGGYDEAQARADFDREHEKWTAAHGG